jgi:hypothetical protein
LWLAAGGPFEAIDELEPPVDVASGHVVDGDSNLAGLLVVLELELDSSRIWPVHGTELRAPQYR